MALVAPHVWNPSFGTLLREELRAVEERTFVWSAVELKGEVENTASKLEVTSTLTGEIKLRGQIKVKSGKSVEKETEVALLEEAFRPKVEQKIIIASNGVVISRLFIPTTGKMSFSIKQEETKEASFDNIGFPLV